jgi:DNA-binding NarL/FixJ family response regulator
MTGVKLGTQAPQDHLSERDRKIIELAAQGADNRDIAKEVGMNAMSLKQRMSKIYNIVGVWNRTELAAYWWKGKLEEATKTFGRPTCRLRHR